MSEYVSKVKEMKNKAMTNYWAKRILAELEFGYRLSDNRENRFDAALDAATDFIYKKCEVDGYITRQMALKAEEMLATVGEEAKKLTLNCVAHAHIDMNWQWRYDETVSITLDTFRTMLDLMKEYPEFKFSQSQASVYEIVEKHHPDMLKEIKKRVKEGRWEVTAATWVESDNNLPNGESFARHVLYTKKYLSGLLDLDPESLNMDFIPDTFGHNVNLPELLSGGGVKYFYYGRCGMYHNVFKWRSPSGAEILVYRDPYGYNASIDPEIFMCVPDFTTKYGLTMMNRVCGASDHGGGPTRRDIEYLLDMNKWPVTPQIRFGSYADFMAELEKVADKVPVVDQELNFVFTGCYTSQSRIKMANRKSEAKLNESEMASAFSSVSTGYKYKRGEYEKAWRKALFAHFHDILPGSGTIDTREHALGEFQNILAVANVEESESLRAISAKIDTLKYKDKSFNRFAAASEGAGVGYEVNEFKIPTKEIGLGITRIYHVFNPSQNERTDVIDINLWDWEGMPERMQITDTDGNRIEHFVIPKTFAYRWYNKYWQHDFMKALIRVTVPACGYKTLILTQVPDSKFGSMLPNNDPEHKEWTFIMQNDKIKVVFDSMNFAIVSIIDKATGEDLIAGGEERHCGFRFIEENGRGMSSWNVGRYMNVSSLHFGQKAKWIEQSLNPNALKQYIKYEIPFRSSKLAVTVSLNKDSSRIDFDADLEWFERGTKETLLPQLNFFVPVSYKADRYKYDISAGTIIRPAVDHDVPGNSWGLAMREGAPAAAKSLMLISETRYGFRGWNNGIGLDLVRSSYDPDPYPEIGMHKLKFAVAAITDDDNAKLVQYAYEYNHPLVAFHGRPNKPAKTALPPTMSFMSVEDGSVAVSAVKMPESGRPDELIVRLYECNGKSDKIKLKFFKPVKSAAFTDINENALDTKAGIKLSGDTISFEAGAYKVINISVKF